MNLQPPDRLSLSGRWVDIEDNPLEQYVAPRNFELARQLAYKTVDDDILLDADHRVERATHSDIRDIRCTVGQDAFIGGLNVGVGAIDRGHATRKVPTHGIFLGRGFRMHVDNDDPGMLAVLLQKPIDATERIIDMVRHENSSLEVND